MLMLARKLKKSCKNYCASPVGRMQHDWHPPKAVDKKLDDCCREIVKTLYLGGNGSFRDSTAVRGRKIL